MHHQSTDVVRDQMEECSGDGAGAMYGTGSTMYCICSTGYGVLLCTGYALSPL